MNKLILLALVVCLPIAANAQMAAMKAQQERERVMPDSLKYVLPLFESGQITFSNGEFASGKLNICTLDQCVHFIDTDGSVKALDANETVDRVRIGNYLFLKYNGQYVGLSDSIGEIYLGVIKNVRVETDKKTGAYGAKSETTNIHEYSSLTTNGVTYDLSAPILGDYKFTQTPMLIKGKVIYPVTKRRLEKYFPDKVDVIEAYIDEHHPNLNVLSDVLPLFDALKK